MTNPEPMRLAQEDRAELADFLAGLAPEQWDAAPTLCHKWTVRDVVAHVISYDDLGPVGFVGRFAAGHFNPDQANQVGVDQYARLTPDELLAELKGYPMPPSSPSPPAARAATPPPAPAAWAPMPMSPAPPAPPLA